MEYPKGHKLPISSDDIEQLRLAGYVIVPHSPNDEMLILGAPSCYNASDGNWETALYDARECFRSMIEGGCLR